MTLCTHLNATLELLPVAPGFWRQHRGSRFVRRCQIEDVCLGGTLAGDASCRPGHRGPLCAACVTEPQHYGGRGRVCRPCSGAGDERLTLALLAIGIALLLALFVALYSKCKREANTFVRDVYSSKGSFRGGTSLKTILKKRAENVKAKHSHMAAVLASFGVKGRILISLFQVVTMTQSTFNIPYPDFYSRMLDWSRSVNLPIDVLPFGCVLPSANSFLFHLVSVTVTPLVVVLTLQCTKKYLQARHGRHSFGVELCADLEFYLILYARPRLTRTSLLCSTHTLIVCLLVANPFSLVYPSCSATTFTFFMTDEFDHDSEFPTRVMRADHSIDTTSALYTTFWWYSGAMMFVYPFGGL
jgi:hypothetical protein